MVLGHGHRRHSLNSARSSTDSTRGDAGNAEDETVVDAEQGSMLTHIISQLRPGADLSRVTLPTFILEPRSMLERITNFMAHPETLLPLTKIEDPVQRFVAVTKFYLSGWHIKPPGVKKPLNPILGEKFTCYWDYSDNTRGYYISEQTSHHPPKSSYFFMAPEHHIRIDGTLKPRSKFLGNSAASMMEGIAVMRFLNTGERFFITQPNMYARGILFGNMKYELGDHSYIRCPETGMVADLEFKTKGYFGGTYNAIGGFISDEHGKQLYELSGMWNKEMWIKDLTTGKKELLFDATHAKETPPIARPLEEQEERESQRLWHATTEAVKRKDQDAATDDKARIENIQREEAAKRTQEGVEWQPQLFRRVEGGQGGNLTSEEDLDWIINANIDGKTPEEQVEQILQIAAILPGQTPARKSNIPVRPRATSPEHISKPQQPAIEAAKSQPELPQQSALKVAEPQTLPQTQPSQQPTLEVAKSQTELPQPPDQTSSNLTELSDPVMPAQPQVPPPSNPVHGTHTTNLPPSALLEQKSVPETSTQESNHPFSKELPPSKLLNSVKGSPGDQNALRRYDSETQEVDEFHDAIA